MYKGLFLDRDGIINVDHGYVYKKENFEFNEGIFPLLKFFIKHNYKLYIVTNQSGIGQNYYSEKDFLVLTEWMLEVFKKGKIIIEEVIYCPHTNEENCLCRKPKIGMINQILKKHQLDLNNSWLIGDKQSDINLAINSKIQQIIAIGKRKINKANFYFSTILECKNFLDANIDTITL